MSRNMGIQWAASCLGFIGLALTAAPVIMLVWGQSMRRRSAYSLKKTAEVDSQVSTSVQSIDEGEVGREKGMV